MLYKYVSDSKRMMKPLPPGARVECRDAQWVVRNCRYANELGSYVVEVEGTEGLVENLAASFLDVIDVIKERVIIFTESKLTQQALKDNLSCDRKLRSCKQDQKFNAQADLVIMHAGLSEETQQNIVEAFASKNSKINAGFQLLKRLLCSAMAS